MAVSDWHCQFPRSLTMPYQTIYAGPMRLALLVIMLAASGCGKAPSAPVPRQAVGADEQAKLNVLFVGNSLTSRNDLPGMLEALIESAGEGPE